MNFFVSSGSLIENKRKSTDRLIFEPCKNAEKAVEYENTVIPIIVGALGIVPKSLEKKLVELDIGPKIETIQTKPHLKIS